MRQFLLESTHVLLLRILPMACFTVSLASLHRAAFPSESSMRETVYHSSFNVVLLLNIFCFGACMRRCAPKSWGLQSRQTASTPYATLEHGQAPADEFYERPRLLMRDVYTFVYGLGFMYYVVAYVLTYTNLAATQVLIVVIYLANIHELDMFGKKFFTPMNMLRLLCTTLVLTGVLLRGCDNGYQHMIDTINAKHFFGLVFCILSPLMVGLAVFDIKRNKRYTVGDVYEICEFGVPFACICAVGDIVLYTIYTSAPVAMWKVDFGNLFLVLTIAPVILFIVIILFMQSLMHEYLIDTLLAISLASTSYAMMLTSPVVQTFDAVCLCLCCAGLVIRMSMFTECAKNREKQFKDKHNGTINISVKPRELDDIADIEDYDPDK